MKDDDYSKEYDKDMLKLRRDELEFEIMKFNKTTELELYKLNMTKEVELRKLNMTLSANKEVKESKLRENLIIAFSVIISSAFFTMQLKDGLLGRVTTFNDQFKKVSDVLRSTIPCWN